MLRNCLISPSDGPRTWLVIKFFFDFRAGAEMENRLIGLLQSLLGQICEVTELPNSSLPKVDKTTAVVSLRKMLLGLLAQSTCNFCLSLDGVDEYAYKAHTSVSAASEDDARSSSSEDSDAKEDIFFHAGSDNSRSQKIRT